MGKIKQISKFRQRIELWKINTTDDGQGGATSADVLLCELWGSFKPLTGTRAINYKQLTNDVGYQLTLRYRTNQIDTENNYIKYNDVEYQFDEIINIDERREFIECILRSKE
jgi:SPP1 family predicted phage head-tail adaptor